MLYTQQQAKVLSAFGSYPICWTFWENLFLIKGKQGGEGNMGKLL